MIKRKADIFFFSRTGNTKKVAEIIFRELSGELETNLIEIQPKRRYPYLIWLGLSFLPNFGVNVKCEDVNSDVVFICFPKWTLNCPPITTFLRRSNLKGKTVFVVITCGGFDEKRYAASYKKKIEKLGARVREVNLIKRSKIKKRDLSELWKFISRVRELDM